MKMRKNSVAKEAANKTKQDQCPESFKRGSKNFRPNLAMEKLAADVTKEFSAACLKLKELRPRIKKIQRYFQKNVRGSVTLAGCGSFREFCKDRLHRSEQAVYRMLSSDGKKQKEKKKHPKPPTTKPVLASQDIERLRAACSAASRYFEADDNGNKEKAKIAKAEFLAITNAESFKPFISGDVPIYSSILFDLLGEICRVNKQFPLPIPLMRVVDATRKRLGVDDESFGILPAQKPLPSAATELPASRAMAAQPGAAQTGAMPIQA
jgi:hypothetical protein